MTKKDHRYIVLMAYMALFNLFLDNVNRPHCLDTFSIKLVKIPKSEFVTSINNNLISCSKVLEIEINRYKLTILLLITETRKTVNVHQFYLYRLKGHMLSNSCSPI